MQESPSPFEDGNTILRGDKETPFNAGRALQVTPEEAAGIRAFIRELKPGIYVKCSTCLKMKYSGNVRIEGTGGNTMFICEGCAP